MTLPSSLAALGEEVEDPTTETFLLFSQPRPSQDLGYVDKTKAQLELSIGGRDFFIKQSPTLLSSDRAEGTTGAVLWKITPFFAAWMMDPRNSLFNPGLIDKDAAVLELGCGTSSILPAVISPYVGSYIATDLEYVINGNLLRKNFAENEQVSKPNETRVKQKNKKPRGSLISKSNVEFLALDWESSDIADLPKHCKLTGGSVDVVIACDCIYNEALILPFVQTCADICRLKAASAGKKPAVCIVAQQLRSDTVFAEWLSVFHERFRVWRVPDSQLTDELKDGSGFCVHIGIVKEL